MRKIVIVEDDEKLCRELEVFLTNNGYEAEHLEEEACTTQGILKKKPDLLLLDIGLPNTDGLYLCRELRKVSEIPIVMITSQDTQMAELMSMSQGADDFVTKPFHPQILLAHMEAILKRVYREPCQNEKRNLGLFVLDLTKGIVEAEAGSVDLTKNELRILDCLARHKNQIVSRDELISYLWDSELFVDDNTLTVNMTRLRGKLSSIGICDVIQTKRGLGYRLVCDTEAI
ncbi:MAG: response regulator transcription factor [Lachnospiraceae bacterium]|jgi:DNA-binding response OmpR family regulator|nr:response regulator transcription factor [Lachnospiraceae bacterium]